MNDHTCHDAIPTLRRFHALCALADLHGYRQDCRAGRCASARKCTGGPRGTFSRFAIPACLLRERLLLTGENSSQEAIARALMKKCPPVKPYQPWNEPPLTRPKPQGLPPYRSEDHIAAATRISRPPSAPHVGPGRAGKEGQGRL